MFLDAGNPALGYSVPLTAIDLAILTAIAVVSVIIAGQPSR